MKNKKQIVNKLEIGDIVILLVPKIHPYREY